MTRKRKVWIAQQGAWNMRLESMPLAAGYLKAYAYADDRIRAETDIRVFSFGAGATTLGIVDRLCFEEMPDVVAFSVLGWNYNRFKNVAAAFKQLNPQGWVIFGGNHVSNQAARVFAEVPAVDIVVNGEGEVTFACLLSALLAGTSVRELNGILGISFRDADGRASTTLERERIRDLDIIPSPILSGAIPLLDDSGCFRYDVAIMETNRGCPYKCAFCYWGGAVGQKVRAFSRERLRAELELYGRLRVSDVALCDANFGLFPSDLEFVEDLIEVRGKYGFPRNFEVSWAKNKSKTFFTIVRLMHEGGFHTNFTLALQSLSEPALKHMRRQNMRVNDWEDLASWLRDEGLDSYAELIWGCPGETYETFIEGYDRLAKHVYRIATYPQLLLPNTEYADQRDKFGFKTIRGETDDYEYVLSHCSMSVEDNRRMHRFLFWARVFAEYMVFRNLWWTLRSLENVTQSTVLLSLDAWLDGQTRHGNTLRALRQEVVDNLDLSRVDKAIRYMARAPELNEGLKEWWVQHFVSRISERHRDFLTSVFEYDLLTRPLLEQSGRPIPAGAQWATDTVDAVQYDVLVNVPLLFDVSTNVGAIRTGRKVCPERVAKRIDLYYKVGFTDFVDNHEFYPQYVGKERWQLVVQKQPESSKLALIRETDLRAVVEDVVTSYKHAIGPEETSIPASALVRRVS